MTVHELYLLMLLVGVVVGVAIGAGIAWWLMTGDDAKGWDDERDGAGDRAGPAGAEDGWSDDLRPDHRGDPDYAGPAATMAPEGPPRMAPAISAVPVPDWREQVEHDLSDEHIQDLLGPAPSGVAKGSDRAGEYDDWQNLLHIDAWPWLEQQEAIAWNYERHLDEDSMRYRASWGLVPLPLVPCELAAAA